ncbi:MAG: hypothetical protein HYU53_02800 [Acidobacteria bacterium]|nr:hypothetical protein [Acidobacteriota bacterium]
MEAIDLFAPLFGYPDEAYAARAGRCAAETGSAPIREFADAVARLSTGELQEQFIQAFDLNPASTLEIGWHLFGEQYERGEFMVDIRRRLREAGVPETGELPDHLLHVLPLVARLAPADARAFIDRFLVPALGKIATGLPKDGTFAPLVSGVIDVLAAGAPAEAVAAGGRHG